jgi:hypothetical protein
MKPAMKISNHQQLFLDDVMVARMTNLRRELQRPQKHPANPLIAEEYPWESRALQVYGTVLFEPHLGKYRCWYLGSRGSDDKREHYMCYAESDDGLHWTKPMVGLPGLLGYERNNIVVPGGHGLCVLHTPDDPDPQRRYKGLGGKTRAFSPDGVRWSLEPFAAAGKNDTGSSVVCWNGEYLAYVRNQERDPDWPGVMRAVALSTSPDFRSWSPKQTMLMTDEQDGYPWTQPYGLEVTAYGDQLIGLLPVLYIDRIPGLATSLGTMKVQLVASRDGRRWERVADRAILMEPTPDPSGRTWDAAHIFPSTTLVLKDDLIRIYYSGSTRRHGDKAHPPSEAVKGIGLATLPADRFVALTPADGASEGMVQTPPLLAAGKDLLVNAEATPEDLQVELVGRTGRVVPGFAREDCRLLRRDPLRYQVEWEASGRRRCWANAPQDRPLALRFFLRRGSLFAFQVTP